MGNRAGVQEEESNTSVKMWKSGTIGGDNSKVGPVEASRETYSGTIDIIKMDEDLDNAQFFDREAFDHCCCNRSGQHEVDEFTTKWWQFKSYRLQHGLAFSFFAFLSLFCLGCCLFMVIVIVHPGDYFDAGFTSGAVISLILFALLWVMNTLVMTITFAYVSRQCYILNRNVRECCSSKRRVIEVGFSR